MTGPVSSLQSWLSLVQAFIWPTALITGLLLFKRELRALLTRISSVKYGDTEVAFQTPVDDAKPSVPSKPSDVIVSDGSRSLTESGVRAAINSAGVLAPDDEIYRTTRIFQTSTQSTWVAFSKQKVVCLLDDEATRSSGRLVQWVLPRTAAEPVKAHPYKATVGLLDIGSRKRWLFSTRLYPTPEAIENDIREAIKEGGV